MSDAKGRGSIRSSMGGFFCYLRLNEILSESLAGERNLEKEDEKFLEEYLKRN